MYAASFHFDVFEEAIRDLQQYLARKAAQMQQAEAELRALSAFNHRQKALLTHALHHPHADYTVESHRKSHDVRYDTARTDLLSLEQAGLLQKLKRGKAFEFRPVKDLTNRLKS